MTVTVKSRMDEVLKDKLRECNDKLRECGRKLVECQMEYDKERRNKNAIELELIKLEDERISNAKYVEIGPLAFEGQHVINIVPERKCHTDTCQNYSPTQ